MRSDVVETPPLGGAESLAKRRLARLLAEARAGTLGLVAPLSSEDLERVHSTLLSPLAWDLGHIAAFEDLWGSRAAGAPSLRPELAPVYDAGETPRARRGELHFLRADELHLYLEAVRERTLAALTASDLGSADPLHAGGFVWEMLAMHERQHNETMLQTLHLARAGTFVPDRVPPPVQAPPPGPEMVLIEAGPFLLGAERDAFVYDNERPQHVLDLPAFRIDRLPVSVGAYRAWMDDGGYRRREWWTEEGWAWRTAEGVERPQFWTDDGRVRTFERTVALDDDLPVMHVSWYEADAFARARGARLPTEAEWEKAATWDPARGRRRRYPWGDDAPGPERANGGVSAFGPARAGGLPAGASPVGVLGLLGDAWEWTASEFGPYPGFRAFPYREYSEIHFGAGYRVLRGGSWATRTELLSPSNRNWDLPQRRQIFAGFRCAASA